MSEPGVCEVVGLVDLTLAAWLGEMDCAFNLYFHNCELSKGHFGDHLCWCGCTWVFAGGRAAVVGLTRR